MLSRSSGGSKSLGNRKQLRVVETIYDVDGLNAATQKGLRSLILTVSKNPDLRLRSLLIQNKATGELKNVSSRHIDRQYDLPPLIYSEKEWELLLEINDYARVRKSEQNWGAYILPEKIQIDERVYIADLIEDVVATAFWGSVYYAVDGIAVWNGTDLILDHDEYNSLHMVG